MHHTREQQSILVERLRSGDSTAWTDAYALCGPLLRRTLLRLSSPEDIEDLVQMTMIRVHDKLNLFDGTSSFSTWVVTVGTNLALVGLRKRRRDNAVVPCSIDDTQENSSGSYGVEYGYADRTIEQREAHRMVHTALENLKPAQRHALRLQMEGLSMDEIASVMCVPAASVKSHIHRGKASLTSALGAYSN